MDLAVKLEAFEGPLDLLLQLIDRQKINIYDIPIAQITDQYLAYMESMDKKDLDMVSEFLVMAATLLDIKAKMLLPKEETYQEEDEDPREELVRRLLEYRKYKYMGTELREQGAGAEALSFKFPTLPREVEQYRPPINLDDLLGGVTLQHLETIFREVIKRETDRLDVRHQQFGKIQKEAIPISKRMKDVKHRLEKGKKVSFRDLLSHKGGKTEVVVTFLAILELIKTGEIFLTEDSTRDDIILEGI